MDSSLERAAGAKASRLGKEAPVTPGYMVFWAEDGDVWNEFFEPTEMSQALTFMADLRKIDGVEFVTLASQNSDSVGKPGVDTVADGKTPDGHPYEWSKQHRAGATRKRS